MKKRFKNDHAYVWGIASVIMIVVGLIVIPFVILALIGGIQLANNIDNAKCQNIIVNSEFINQSSDGFSGIETHYYISSNNLTLELEPNGNATAIAEWLKIPSERVLSIRSDSRYFVPCDYPRFL